MNQSVGTIYYEVEADTSKLVNSSDRLDKNLDGLDKGFRRTDAGAKKFNGRMKEVSRSVKKANAEAAGATKALSAMRTVLVSIGAGLLVKNLTQAVDTYSELRSQLRLVTKDQQDLNRTFDATYRLAQETRGSLEGTVNLYARLARSTEELDLSSDDLLKVTKAINQSFVVSGASAQEAASATLQLSQGMASGTLRGEELNSVLENSPRLARAIAEGLGVTIGQLREMGAEGKLTGSAVTQALLQTADSIDKEFQKMPRTVGQALQQLRNDMLITFGQTDLAGFNSAIDDLRKLVTDPNFQKSVVDLGTAFATLVGWLGQAASKSLEVVRNFNQAVNAHRGLLTISGQVGESISAIESALNSEAVANGKLRVSMKLATGEIIRQGTSVEELKKRLMELRALGKRYADNPIAPPGSPQQAPNSPSRTPPSSPPSKEAVKAIAAAEKRVQALLKERDALKLVSIERAKLQAVEGLGEGATDKQVERAKELADQIYRLKQIDEAREQIKSLGKDLSVAGLRGEELAVAQAKLQLGEFVPADQVEQVERFARALFKAQNGLSILTENDPIAAEQDRYQKQLDDLNWLNEQKLLSDQRYRDLTAQAERAHQEEMLALQEQNFRAQSEFNDVLMASIDQFGSAATNAITGVLSGVNNTREALQMLAQGILSEVVGAFVQMGIAQVKAMVMGKTAQAAAAAGYATSVAGQVQANTALAAQAAFASTAAIPIVGPGMAPAAAGAAAAQAASLGAPAIAASTAMVAGGRQYGGPVAANKLYRINENGKPEVFTASNGQQYMLPNARGEVVSNADAAGSESVMLKAQAPARVTIINQFNGDGTVETKAPAGMESMGREIQEVVDRHINQKLRSEMRPGGLLYKRGGNG